MLTAKEAQDLKTITRKLQLEVEEKNEIINVLKDELVTLREQSDKFQKENIQLVKDAKRVKFLQDENDFLQDKVGSVELLELEIKRLKEKLNESEFFKIRIKELEEDLTKSQSESSQFECKLQEADGRLTRVPELEAELERWKSFSNELEQEKNSLQSKLLESIEHESKLNSNNKKVEDEVKRLRDLIKSYEEERDEEQASNSLIMSVADLKQFDLAEQQRQVSVVDVGTDPHDADVQECGQQTELSDTAEKSIGTDPLPDQSAALEAHETHRLALDSENTTLKEELKRRDTQLSTLAGDNERIRNELDSNRKMISDLRQDLACEKSLAQKLTTQLASFTKQIKSLDKQYFPMHDTSSKTTPPAPSVSPASENGAKNNQAPAASAKSAQTTLSKPNPHNGSNVAASSLELSQVPNGKGGNQSIDPASKPCAANALEISSNRCVVFDSRGDMKSKQPTAVLRSGTRKDLLADAQPAKLAPAADGRDDESTLGENGDKFGDGQTKSRPVRSKNFVRNSLASRSVNYGHSKSPAYLDRIRASVTATTTTNSSFSEQTAVNNVMVTSQQQQQLPISGAGHCAQQRTGRVLNCMLDHQHLESCFVMADAAVHGQSVRTILPQGPIYGNHQYNGRHAHAASPSDVVQSRQLNALIDPAAHEQLMLGMLQTQLANPAQALPPIAGPQLLEQQVAHLNDLHRQHYFHHLHQLHQMHHQHHLHHMHHMNHKCAQQQHQQQQPPPPQQHQQQVNVNVGSQFYAPGGRYDQIYTNAAIINNGANQMKEQQQQNHATKLVNKNNEKPRQSAASPQQGVRVSPHRSSSAFYHMNNNLAQIDEMNGLPTVHNQAVPSKPTRTSPSRSDRTDRINGIGQPGQTNVSPVSLSSPTSSRTSSNISPSSESSSSSGTNSSLTSSAVPLTRSALRHTTTDLGRRQFSVERELISTAPLTATLSRVNNGVQLPTRCDRISPSKETGQLRAHSAQSQQPPPMRSSKIYSSVGQQSNNSLSAPLAAKTNGNVDGLSRISSSLAHVKLNDNLAFSSLRVPKKSTSGVSLNNTFVADQSACRRRPGVYENASVGSGKLTNSSSSPSNKLRAAGGSAKSGSSPTSSANNNNNNNNNNNSSVWFEYGCI